MANGTMIKTYRTRKGMTQKQLADLCGIHDANIRKYESGRQNPKLETLQKIADALAVDVGALLGFDEYAVSQQEVKDDEREYWCKHLNKTVDALNAKGVHKLAESATDLVQIKEYQREG